ncbi:hypothetical protein BC826DRAFT_1141634 [Russula brevipes]|nr:hypothetical protein BC826DRAFT_1141634 [Russula brevipes]
MMSGIHTLRSLLIPNGQDTRCFVDVNKADETPRQSGSATTSFCPSSWEPKRLPLFAHPHNNLHTKMLEHLATIFDRSYSDQAARASLTDPRGSSVTTPNDMSRCEVQERTSSNQVISDFSYRVDGGVKVLGKVKSPLAFDYFIGALMDQMRDGSSAMVNMSGMADEHSLLILSEEGRSLSHLENFALSLIERLILFAEVYCVHYMGVAHRDLDPRNVLRKRWSWIFKIIDFGFSDVDHTCTGWRECYELKEMWRRLQLDRVNF